MTDVLSSALSLAARGWAVFPVQIGDKAPLAGTAGYKDATTDPKQIKAWWFERPTANVAVAAGLSGLLVLDVDTYKGGQASLDELTAKHGALPPTFTVRTGRGGLHYYFKATPVRSRTEIRNGLDVKSHGGYVLGPGSKTENVYEIISDVPPVDAPQWLVELCEPPRDATSTPTGDVLDGMLGLAFEHAGWLGKDHGPGMRLALCPFAKEHSTGSDFDSSTVLFAPDLAKGHVRGWLDCKHRCESRRTQADFWNALPAESRRYAELKHIERTVETGATSGSAPVRDWSDALHRENGEVKKSDDNAIVILTNEPNWKGCLAVNQMTGRPEWRKVPPVSNPSLPPPRLGPVKDSDWALINAYMHRVWKFKELSKTKAHDLIDRVAESNTYHPVVDYLTALKWDGKPRVREWLITYCHATNDPEYLCLVGTWWLVSAVARVFVPGCDAQLVLILEGPQGARKSTTFRILGGQWFRDTPLQIDHKDAMAQLQGAWIYELAELASLSKSDYDAVKVYVSSPVDTFREAYGRRVGTFPRSCIFGGSVNPDKAMGLTYLKDPTGARRFLPVYVPGLIDTDGLMRDRDQLWAEAVVMYCNGQKWKPMSQAEFKLCQTVQEERSLLQEEDPVFDHFLRWSKNKPTVNLAEYSEMHDKKLSQWELSKLGSRLRAEGWSNKTVKNRRIWINPDVTVKEYSGDLDWTKGEN